MLDSKQQLEIIKTRWQQAQTLQSEGKLEAAFERYHSILEIDGRYLPALHQMAKICEGQGQFFQAIEIYQQAIKIDKTPPFWIYRHLGYSLSQSGDLEGAIEAYQKAISLQPEDIDTYNLLGQVQGKIGDFEGATSNYRKAIELDANQPSWVYLNLADALKELENFDEAILAYEKVLKLEPENLGIRKLLGVLLARKEVNQRDLTQRARQLQQEGRLDEALVEYRAILAVDSTNLTALHQVALIYERQGRLEETVEVYRKAVEVDTESPFWVYRHLGFALNQQGDLDGAVEAYQRAIGLNSSDAETYLLLGQALESRDKPQEALLSYQKVVELNSQQSSGFYITLGNLFSLTQQFNEAIKSYSFARNLDPSNPEIYRLLAEAKVRNGDVSGALSDCSKTVEIQSIYWQIYHNIGDVCFELSQWSNAAFFYEKSLELNPKFEWSYYNLGAVLEKQKKWSDSIFMYKKAMGLNPDLPCVHEKIEEIFKYAGHDTLPSSLEQAKTALDCLNKIFLENLLSTKSYLCFPEINEPKISIILILYNRAELTLSCLESISKSSFKSLEVIIVDNCSTDLTKNLLQQVRGAKIIYNEENLHFLLACNQATQIARGNYLLFLNNDAQILGDSLNIAIETIESASDIGAVGGKIILPDGTLQEAGSIIWEDGSCLGYGRGDSPTAPQYMFERSVDYCSGAFLLTDRNLFLNMGGFDENYQPAYYEETDYCVRLLRSGKRIIYNPRISILHYEFASSKSSEASGEAIELQKRNQNLFIESHKSWLSHQLKPKAPNIIFARTARGHRKRILFLEDKIPHTFLGSGYTRGNCILSSMIDLGFFVTLYPTDLLIKEDWELVYSDISHEVEVMNGYTLPGLEHFLQEREGYYDLVFVSRPHNMEHLEKIPQSDKYLQSAKIIYDAEALYCLRDIELKRLGGEILSQEAIEAEIKEELKLAKRSDSIISVSEKERSKFIEYGYPNVHVLGHSVTAVPTQKSFSDRKDLLFVGAIYDIQSPNADSVLWLGEEIFSLIQSQIPERVNLIVAGTNKVEKLNQKVESFGNSSIKLLGRVEDLTDLYNSSRIFVVPTRFAAGIPHKAHEAAAKGIPMVTTSLIAQQLGWRNEIELLIADTAQEFAKQCVRLYTDSNLWNQIRINALGRVKVECSPQQFTKNLSTILSSI